MIYIVTCSTSLKKNRSEYNLSRIVLYNYKKLHDIFNIHFNIKKKSFVIQYILVNIFTQVTVTAEPFSVILYVTCSLQLLTWHLKCNFWRSAAKQDWKIRYFISLTSSNVTSSFWGMALPPFESGGKHSSKSSPLSSRSCTSSAKSIISSSAAIVPSSSLNRGICEHMIILNWWGSISLHHQFYADICKINFFMKNLKDQVS